MKKSHNLNNNNLFVYSGADKTMYECEKNMIKEKNSKQSLVGFYFFPTFITTTIILKSEACIFSVTFPYKVLHKSKSIIKNKIE